MSNYRKLVLNNILFTSLGRLLNFSFFIIVPVYLNNIDRSDSNLYYYSLITILLSFFTIIFTNIISSVLVKEKLLNNTGIAGLISALFSWLVLITALLVVLLLFCKQTIIRNLHVTTYFAQYEIYLAVAIVVIWNDFLRCILQSYNLFNEYARAVVLQNFLQAIFFCICSYLWGDTISIPLALLLANVFLTIKLLHIYTVNKMPVFKRISFKVVSEFNILKIGYPLLIAHVITLVVAFSFEYYASSFKGGIYTMYNIAFRLYMLPLLFILNPLSEILNKRFSEMALCNMEKLANEVLFFMKTTLLGLLPILIISYSFLIKPRIFEQFLHAIPVIGEKVRTLHINFSMLFSLIAVLLLHLLFNSINQYAGRIYFALHKTFLTSIAGTIVMTISLCLLFSYKTTIWGVLGTKLLPEILLLTPVSLLFIKSYLNAFDMRSFLLFFCKTLTIILVVIAVDFLIFRLMLTQFFMPAYITTVSVTLLLNLFFFYQIFRSDIKYSYSHLRGTR